MDVTPISKLSPRDSRGNEINAVNGVFLGLGLILVVLRVYVRTKVSKAFGWDDTFIILALATAFVAMGMEAASIHYGIGEHSIYIEPAHAIQAAKWSRIGQMPWVLSTMLTKISISIFLYRIFALNKKSKRALYPINILNLIGNLASFTTILSQCSPPDKLWEPNIPGSCWNPKTQLDIGVFQGAVSAFCDFALAFLPVVLLWNVQIKKHVKIGICILMGLGFFTGICAIVRTVLLAHESPVDVSYTMVTLTVWAM
ncbi:MAG: hypothetical protein Q9181_000190 [Wetmoreana brouardii]